MIYIKKCNNCGNYTESEIFHEEDKSFIECNNCGCEIEVPEDIEINEK